jgi:hypothetical protein
MDPAGPKTYESYRSGSGSATLILTGHFFTMLLPGDLDKGVALEPEPVDLVELPAGELEERLLLALQHLLRHNLDCAPRHAFQILAEACAQS